MVTDYVKTGKPNKLIRNPSDYCAILLEEDDYDIWRAEWDLCAQDLEWFAKHWLWIVDRDTKKSKRFTLNETQRYYHIDKTNRDIILKARKMGISTYVCARFFHSVCFEPNTIAVIMAHIADSSEFIFDTIRRFYDNLPAMLKPKERYNSKKMLELVENPFGIPLNTKYIVKSAESKHTGVGTDVHKLHLSEYAKYKHVKEINSGIMQAAAGSDCTISIESTAEGFNEFWEEYKRATEGTSDYKPFFFAWWMDQKYRREVPANEKIVLSEDEKLYQESYGLDNEQIHWYRKKKADPGMYDSIKKEYPTTEKEAFMQLGDTIFDQDVLNRWFVFADKIETLHGGLLPRKHKLNERLRIYKRPVRKIQSVHTDKEQRPHEYILGIDTATGEAGDRSFGVVLDIDELEVVATFEGRDLEIFDFKRIMTRLGRMYNDAKFAPETNSYGHSVLDYAIKEDFYPNIFKYVEYDKRRPKAKGQIRKGFYTSNKTRPLMIADTQEFIKEDELVCWDKTIIKELMAFVRHEDGKEAAQTGMNDDAVFALMICLYVFKRHSVKINIGRA